VLDDMLTPEELSGWVLQHLKQLAEEQLGEAVTGAVVTVPAHFQQAQQEGTHAAATQAGIPQVQLLQEPVAAALAYGINGGTDGDTVLVFDVGGGTFDIRWAWWLPAFHGMQSVCPLYMYIVRCLTDMTIRSSCIDAADACLLFVCCAPRHHLLQHPASIRRHHGSAGHGR
jgi:hypothetical protein